MPRSGIRVIMDRSAQMSDCIHLEVGQPDFATPPHIIEAVSRYAREGHTHYGPNAGADALRQAAARYFERKTGVTTGPQNIICTIGAVGSCATAWLALCDPGDEVLLPDPTWPNYGMGAATLHGKVVNYSLQPANDFLPDFDELESLISPRTKVLLVCNPSNPIGCVYDADTMARLMAFCRRHDLYMISDEIYSEICFDAEHASALPHDTDERALIVSGVSKSYAMTGFRVGFTRASESYVALATKLQEPIVSCGTTFAQMAAAAALDGPQECVAEMVAAYRRRRDLAVDMLRRLGLYRYTPGGAFYVLVDIAESGLDGDAFALKLLEEKKVAVAPGPTFGKLSRNHVRVSLAATESDIEQGLEQISILIGECKSMAT